ncbi:MAG: LD-carboxypeptidase [Bacteroidales bacterium]|nr:LD-carboxypeptidase [Bacteroidales bacterium]
MALQKTQDASLMQAPFLKKGDTIGIISTARKISLEELRPALDLIESAGFNYLLGDHLFDVDHQMAGTDQQRANDLSAMLANEGISAILCARGGYGTVRLWDKVDWKSYQEKPKWIIGYSDVTVLHSICHTQLKWQSIHASMPINFKDYSSNDIPFNSLLEALKGNSVEHIWESSSDNRHGYAEGQVIGGNLSILYALRGTPLDIDTRGKILLIEDLDEYLYHIDRIMMNLKIGGVLSELKALIVGGLSDMNDNTVPFGKSAVEIVKDAVKDFDFPVVFDAPFGHIWDNRAVVLGRRVQLESNDKLVSLKF